MAGFANAHPEPRSAEGAIINRLRAIKDDDGLARAFARTIAKSHAPAPLIIDWMSSAIGIQSQDPANITPK